MKFWKTLKLGGEKSKVNKRYQFSSAKSRFKNENEEDIYEDFGVPNQAQMAFGTTFVELIKRKNIYLYEF